MSIAREQRLHPRIRLERNVCCYLDGARFDSRTWDLSAGGMLLRLEDPDSVPLNGLVGLVFPVAGDTVRTCFLFGRVVRRQQTPLPGVGLKWESACTLSPPEVLADFLHRLLGIVARDIPQEPTGRGTQTKSVYRFGGNMAAVAPGTRHPEPVPGPAEGAGKAHGAITQGLLRPDVQVAASVPANLTCEGVEVPVRLVRLGLKRVFADTPFAPIDRSGQVSLRFAVLSKDERATIACQCIVWKLSDGKSGTPRGLELEIVACDEGSSAGIYARFLRWMYFRSLAGIREPG
jgi:hypothetical protein